MRPILGTELAWEGGRALLVALERRGFARLSELLTAREEAAEAAWEGPPFDARAALLGDSAGLAVLSEDLALLERAGGREGFFALLSSARKGDWRRLLRAPVPPAAVAEATFLAPADRETQRLLVAIATGRTVDEVGEAELDPPEALLPGPAEFERAFAGLPDALRGTEAVVAAARLGSLFGGWIFPAYPAEGPGGARELLRERAYAGAARRYGTDGTGALPEAVRARLEHELRIIGDKGFADYFLVVADIAARASRTCGRGSAAASIVSYALGVTAVDPLAHDLYFERFLNPGRKDPPDIDVDFAWDERDALLAEVVEHFGSERCARVANHVRFMPRSAFREAARAHGLPEGETGAFERALARDREAALAGADPVWRRVLEGARAIAGLPRHLGVHSGGLVVVPGRLASITPLGRTGSGIRVTAWEKEGVEAAGLVKIDLLGNRSLAVVRDALADLAEDGLVLDRDAWKPLEDPETVELLARGDSMGVFYVESPAMRQLQRKTGRGDYAHLVIHSSIIRPAANAYISEYVDRLKGKPWTALHPLLEGILDETCGIMCYQEDVCKVAIALAGFDAAEADGLRKILSKKDAETKVTGWERRFRAGAEARGVDGATVDAAWAMIRSFEGYSFVKAHSASYAALSFQSAWLRAHHPAHFMAAVISNRGGYYGVLAYASEARRMGILPLPPCVNRSGLRCRGRWPGPADGAAGGPGGAAAEDLRDEPCGAAAEGPRGSLRFGLGMVSALRAETATAIVEGRKSGGAYASIADFAARVPLAGRDAEALVGSGALDALAPGLPRAGILWALLKEGAERGRGRELFVETGCGGSRARRGSGGPGGSGAASTDPGTHPGIGSAERRRRLEAEMRFLGTTLAVHPLELWPRALAARRVLGRELEGLVGRRVELLGWPVAAKEVLASSEEPMEFVSFEDETALYETVLFPEAFARWRHLLLEERPLWIRGRVEEDRGAVSVTVDALEPARG